MNTRRSDMSLRCVLLLDSVFFSLLAVAQTAHCASPTVADIPADANPNVKHLIELTFSPDPAVRGNSASRLGSMKTIASPAVPFLIRLLSDDAEYRIEGSVKVNVGMYASDALKQIGMPAIDPCVAALRDATETDQIFLTDVLVAIGDPRAIRAVVPFINGSNPVTAGSVLMSLKLEDCKDPQIIAPVTQALTTSSDDGVRLGAASLLAKVHDPRAVDALLAALNKDGNAELRSCIVDSLGEQRDPRAFPVLLEALRSPGDQNHSLREQAALSLGKIGDPRALRPLLTVLNDQTASEYLRECGHCPRYHGRLGIARPPEGRVAIYYQSRYIASRGNSSDFKNRWC